MEAAVLWLFKDISINNKKQHWIDELNNYHFINTVTNYAICLIYTNKRSTMGESIVPDLFYDSNHASSIPVDQHTHKTCQPNNR